MFDIFIIFYLGVGFVWFLAMLYVDLIRGKYPKFKEIIMVFVMLMLGWPSILYLLFKYPEFLNESDEL